MKYSILAAFSESIPYIPGLRELTGSSSSAILMMQLEYWFSRYPDGFYKFLEPSQKSPDYIPGDSWTEELAFGKDEFRAAFDRIGIRFNSKTQYEEAKQAGQEFGDKFYLSYLDRQTGLTYYHRSHDRINDFISKVQPRYKGEGKKTRKKTTQPQSQNSDHVGDSDLREIRNPDLREIGISEVGISEDPIYGCRKIRFPDPYIYSETTSENTSSETTIKDPPTPQGGEEFLSVGSGEKISTGEEGTEESQPKTPTSSKASKQALPVKTKSSSKDQECPAPAPVFSVHRKEDQARIVAIYQANKPKAWQPVNNLHRAIRVQVDSLLSSEDFKGDLEAFLTRLENALLELNNPGSNFSWFAHQGNLGITTLLSNYGKHLMEFSDAWTGRREQTQSSGDDIPNWLKQAYEEYNQSKAG